ncbi:MAG: heavy metal translocating P-type ATPase [Burkholderiaceae bacterium]
MPASDPKASMWAALDAPETLAQIGQPLEPSAHGEARVRTVLTIDGVHCAACVIQIEAALALKAESVTLNAATRRASVVFCPASQPLSEIFRAVHALGYGPRPIQRSALDATAQAGRRMALWRMLVALLCMMQVMMYATPRYMAGDGDMSADIHRLLIWAEWLLTLPVLLFAVWPFLAGAWRDLRARRVGMDVPVALGLLVMFVASSLAMQGSGPVRDPVWFDSIAMFAAFLLVGRWIESAARERALAGLADQLAALPETVPRLDDSGEATLVTPQQLRPGDRIRLAAGAVIPADGVVIDRDLRLDESILTGESRPVTRPAGSLLLAGSSLLEGPVVLQVRKTAQQSRASEVAALIAQASASRPRLARQADRWAGPFLIMVLALAASAAAVWLFIEPSRALWVAVSVLIVTCPCALSLAAPAALLSATARLARQGILVRNPDALEALADVDTLLLDKTGTLTDARPHIRRIVLAGQVDSALHVEPDDLPLNINDIDVLGLACAAERDSLHPLAAAIRQEARKRLGPDQIAFWERCIRNVEEHPGEGLSGELLWNDGAGQARITDADSGTDGADRHTESVLVWRLGRWRFACASSQSPQEDEGQSATGSTRVWLSLGGRPVARIEFSQSLRADAATALQTLREAGLSLAIRSGDESGAVAAVADTLGVSDWKAGQSDQDKLADLEALEARGHRVGMVGDGLNDGAALARARVSVSFAQATPLAQQQADLLVLGEQLGALARARALSQDCLRVVRQNLLFAALYNLICIPIALLGWMPPWLAGLGMAASSLIVVLNALRL